MQVSPGSRIALTGATGFVGGHVLGTLLENGFVINALTRREPDFHHDNLNWVRGDLFDRAALRTLVDGAAGIVHVAGAIRGRREDDFYRTNVTGTMHLLSAMQDAGVGDTARYVYLSSLAAREPQLSHYAATKRQAEDIVQAHTPPLDWLVLRPPAVYGPGDRETLAFFKAARSRFALLPGSPASRTSLIHVFDLGRAIVTALITPVTHRIVEVHDGKRDGYSIAEVLQHIAEDAPVPSLAFLRRRPLQMIGTLVLAGSYVTRRTPMLTPGKARELTHGDWVCHDRTLIEEADWKPWISAEEGLAETRAWYEREGWL